MYKAENNFSLGQVGLFFMTMSEMQVKVRLKFQVMQIKIDYVLHIILLFISVRLVIS